MEWRGGTLQLSPLATAILRRYHDKTRIAGGARAGYNLRRRSIFWESGEPASEQDRALAELVEQGLVKPNEAADRYALTAAGAERLGQLFVP